MAPAMRINSDFEENVSRDFLARRASMLAELAARTPRTPAANRGTPAAVPLAGDEVHISPEARGTAWPGAATVAPPGPLRAFPSPAEVVATLRALAALPAGDPAASGAVKVLGRLLAGLARGLPGDAPPLRDSPAAALADNLVRLLLGERPALLVAPRPDVDEGAAFRAFADLLSASAGPSAGPQTVFERATAALVLAVLRWRGTVNSLPLPDTATPSGAAFPPALLSLAGAAPRSLKPRRRRPRSHEDGSEDSGDRADYLDGEEPSAGSYRPTPH